MEELKKQNKPGTTKPETEATENEKTFTAYLEIYGKSKMLAKVYKEFIGDADNLDQDDLDNLVILLENISGIDEENIYHAVLRIAPDENEADDVDDKEE